MKKLERLNRLRSEMIVSCQAYEDNPLYGTKNTLTLAACAVKGGAKALRICWPQQVEAVRKVFPDTLLIGINKQFDAGMDSLDSVYITPTYESADVLIKAGCDVVAMDGTLRGRTYEQLQDIVGRLKQKYPDIVLMADIATIEEAKVCERLGFDILSSTLSGYTRETMNRKDEPDFDLISKMKQQTGCLINGEGRIWESSQIRRMKKLGVDMITIGAAITNPMKTTNHMMEIWKQG